MNYKKIYDLIIIRAKDRILNSYKEKHHIIPKCLGGTDEKSNIVELTPKEHFICHLLLCEIYPKENSLKSARWAMTTLKSKNHNRKYRISSSQCQYCHPPHTDFQGLGHRRKKNRRGTSHVSSVRSMEQSYG
jgi:hypothetical protein